MKRQIISYLIENNRLVQPALVAKLEDPYILKTAAKLVEEKASVQTILDTIQPKIKINEKSKTNNIYNVKVLFDYHKPALKKNVEHFTKYYNKRFQQFEKILLPRLENNISISRLENKTDRETVSVLGMVADKHITKTNKIILTIEDQTGLIKAIFNANNPDTYKIAKDVVLDEIIGITGKAMKGLIFAERIILPEIPVQSEIKKALTKHMLFL